VYLHLDIERYASAKLLFRESNIDAECEDNVQREQVRQSRLWGGLWVLSALSQPGTMMRSPPCWPPGYPRYDKGLLLRAGGVHDVESEWHAFLYNIAASPCALG